MLFTFLESNPLAALILSILQNYDFFAIQPQGTKLNALIEKTAKYVSQHGGQMEIMIKTKQANNPQFAFLSFEHRLNPYYKHQVSIH